MKCAVLGDPIAHSLSPVLHRAAYAELGLDWTYDAIQVASGGLTEFLMTLGDDVRGLSLTMPLKREVMGLVQQVSEIATLAGAANTLIHDEGVFFADNTDLPGAMAALRERYDGPIGAVTILGAGATAASTGLAMAELGAQTITVVARSVERAEATRQAISRHRSHPEVRVATLEEALAGDPAGDVLITTVPAEAQNAALVDRCGRFAVVFEVLYDPWPTPIAAAALERGQVLVSGLDLLIHQAAYQVLLFTGSRAPLDVMRTAGQEALNQRSAPSTSPSTPRSAPRSSGR